MKIMNCPLNGPRNIAEFQCHGEVKSHSRPQHANDDEWTEHLWMSGNEAGVVREWWCHIPTNFWFLAERNTTTDRILATYAIPADWPLQDVT